MGNLISIYASEGHNADYILMQIKRLSLYPKPLEHYARRAQDRQQIEQALRELIVQGIWKRRTLGKAA